MTIDEAIKRLTVAKEGWPLTDSENYYKALELGLEALKYIQRTRQHDLYVKPERLPGETK
jgi:hypothetical protein